MRFNSKLKEKIIESFSVVLPVTGFLCGVNIQWTVLRVKEEK